MDLFDPLTWSILLMLVGCALVIMEVFIPSGGILGFLAGTSVVASVGVAFYYHGLATGVTFAGVAVVVVPVAIMVALHYWPHTAMGQRFLLGPPSEDEVLPDGVQRQKLKQLLGKVGVAKTPMLPAGAIRIEGHTVDAVSQGMPIDAGESVKVIEVRAYRVVVRPIDEAEQLSSSQSDDVLSQPIDDLDLEALDDPLS